MKEFVTLLETINKKHQPHLEKATQFYEELPTPTTPCPPPEYIEYGNVCRH
jgi:hypothetical protein